jgi:hypothetical protein
MERCTPSRHAEAVENGTRNLGDPFKTKREAEKRLRQVEFFKHNKQRRSGEAKTEIST